MNRDLRQAKHDIRAFFIHYTDERLVALLAHARDGKLHYVSCCCFIGIATADHALRERNCVGDEAGHYWRAQDLPGAFEAERAFYLLGKKNFSLLDNALRTRLIIPLIRAEMRRRELARATETEQTAEVICV